MAGYNTSVVFGTLTLNCHLIDGEQRDGTRKQKVGGTIKLIPIPDRAKEWELTITGNFTSTTRDTDRDTLQTMRDNMNKVTLTDGLHDGDYYILRLRWHDGHTRPAQHKYTLTLRQDA